MDKTCSNCEFGYRDELKDLICVNRYSDNCSDYVDENCTCNQYTEKGQNNVKRI